ncbi:hypothetical protein EDD17DRAFT_1896304 [Pisolithus thermaeus]|nr:hypothetical protein EV401DRAFT_1883477 [Pisolithus croceorrhizus]KAI6162409.1 hypothetical protein EDD17DRAFT_1896304 [Pisolithus thermaeus]
MPSVHDVILSQIRVNAFIPAEGMLTYIDEDFLHALSTEISLERFIDEKKADALLSKIASQAASMFTSLNEEVKNFQGKESLAKGAHRSASSFSALFSHASSTLPTDAGPSILDRIESRSQFCTERENEAQRENNLAYNAVVPSTEAPPPIKIACEATPIPIQEIYGSPDGRKAIRADVLMKLIPPSVHGSAGVHSEEKTKLVRKEVENAENAEVEVRSALEATDGGMEARPVPLDVRRWIEDIGTIEDRESVDALMGADAAEGESLRENWKRNRMSTKLRESSTITYGRKSLNKALRQDLKSHMGALDAVATLDLPGLREGRHHFYRRQKWRRHSALAYSQPLHRRVSWNQTSHMMSRNKE